MPSLSQGGRQRKAQALSLPRMVRGWTVRFPVAFRKLEPKARTSKKEWKRQRSIVVHPLSECQWNWGHFSMRKWESVKHKSWGMPEEGFKGHVATDGSLLCTAGKWGPCGWSVVQLDYDEKMGFCMGCTARWRQNMRFSGPSPRGRS